MKKTLLTAAVLAAITSSLSAQSTWTGGAANWSSNANPGWNTTGVPNAIDATADATAAGGTITVNGNFTLGTLTQLGTAGRSLNTGTGGTLIFDVTSGNALWDMRSGLTGTGTSGGAGHSTNVTLNDNTEIRGLVSTGSSSPLFSGIISGTGQLQFTNVATTPTGGGIRIDLRNGSNSYSGGTTLGNGVAIRMNASGAAGTGAITLADTALGGNALDFRADTSNFTQVHANNINFGTRTGGSSSVLSTNSGMNVTLNGVLSGAMSNSGRANFNGSTLILGGSSPNTWTGQLRSDSHGTVIADKVGAINNGMQLRSSTANTTTALLVGVADTITGAVTVDGNNAGAGNSYMARIGLKDGNNGIVIFNSATAININLANGIGGTSTAPTTSLNLHSGNGTGTLVMSTLITNNSGPNTARNISITGASTGIVNLNRAAGNTYTGTTTVSEGTLLINNASGSGTGTGAVTVASGAALGGGNAGGTEGFISGAVTVNGSLRPGNSIGTLTVTNDVTWNAGDAFVFELGTAAATQALANTGSSTQDMLNLTGAGNDFLKGTGTLFTFDFANTGALGFYKLVDWTSLAASGFANGDFAATNLNSGLTGAFIVDNTTAAIYLNVVPEPSTYALLASGLVALAFLRRRKKSV